MASSIYYFMLGNYYTHKEIGNYIDSNIIDSTSFELDDIKIKCKDLFNNVNDDIKNKKNKEEYKNYFIFYTLTTLGTFYLAVARKNTLYSEEENLIFELFEDIDHQGIKKLIDKNGELTRVGKQNLKFCIEQEQNLTKRNHTETIKENEVINFFKMNKEKDVSKISLLNSELNEVKNNVKDSVKNIITNVNEMKELDDKSLKIKDVSYKFQQDTLALEKKMRCRRLYRKFIIIGGAIGLLFLILFFIFK